MTGREHPPRCYPERVQAALADCNFFKVVTEPIENYIPIAQATTIRSQAWKVWIIGLAVVIFWVLLILAAPVAKVNSLTSFSPPLYNFFSYLCHQIPERSFYIEGEPFGVCARCFGVYFGIVAGFAIYPLWRRVDAFEPLSKVWLFLSLIPITIDWAVTYFGYWENNHISRFITGLILGIACATYIVPAIVEIVRNLSLRKRTFAAPES